MYNTVRARGEQGKNNNNAVLNQVTTVNWWWHCGSENQGANYTHAEEQQL